MLSSGDIIPQRVAFIHPAKIFYGAERSLLEVMRKINREKYVPVLIVTEEGRFAEEARAAKIETYVLPWLARVTWRNPAAFLLGLVRLGRWFRHQKVRLVQLNLLHPHLDIGLMYLAARLGGGRFIYRNRIMLTWPSLYQKWWLSKADRIISVTHASIEPALQKRRSDIVCRLRQEQIAIVPSGRDLQALRHKANGRGDARASLGIPPSVPLVGMVAALVKGKRPDIFIQAAADVLQQQPNAWFVLVGAPYYDTPRDRAYVDYIQSLVKEVQLTRRLVLAGYRDDAPRVMKSCDVIVLPSRNEAQGGVLFEAMALGVPVVASGAGGVSEIVPDGKAGLLVYTADPKDFAAAILHILTNKQDARRLGECGRVWSERHDAAVVARAMEYCFASSI